jgi:hypothetical protein
MHKLFPRTRLLLGGLLLTAGDASFATTGISALGAIQDFFVFVLIVTAAVLVIALAITGAARYANGRRPGFILLLFVIVFLFLGMVLFLHDKPNNLKLVLGFAILAVYLGLVWVYMTRALPRAAALGALIALVVSVNLHQPRLVDFKHRVYIDNAVDIGAGNFTRPGHWRVMMRADGRRFMRLQAAGPARTNR